MVEKHIEGSCQDLSPTLIPMPFLLKNFFYFKNRFQLNGLKVSHRIWTAANANVFGTKMARLSTGLQTPSSSLTQPSVKYA